MEGFHLKSGLKAVQKKPTPILFFVLNATACAYYMIFISIWVFCMFFFFGLTDIKSIKKTISGFFLFGFLSLLGTLPIYYPYIKLRGLMNLERPLSYVSAYVAPINILSVGILIVLTLIIIILIKTKIGRNLADRKNMLFYTVMLYLFVMLSFGPYFLSKDYLYNPFYIFLYKFMPGFNVIRNPAKFWAMISLTAGILFAYALTLKNKLISIPITLLIILLCINIPLSMTPLPDNGKVPPVYTWLQKQQGDFAIVELPLTVITDPEQWVSAWSELYNRGDYSVVFQQPLSLGYLFYGLRENIREYYSLYHFKKIFNGYSGYFSYLYLASLQYIPEEQLALFKAIDIKYIIVHKNEFLDQGKLADLLYFFRNNDMAMLELVYDSPNTSVYEILDRNMAFDPEKTYLKNYKFEIFYKKEYSRAGSVTIIPFLENMGDRPAVFLYKNHLVLETLTWDNRVIQKTKLDFIPAYTPFLMPKKSIPFIYSTTSRNNIQFTPEVYRLRLMQDGTTIWESSRNKLVIE